MDVFGCLALFIIVEAVVYISDDSDYGQTLKKVIKVCFSVGPSEARGEMR